LKRGIPVVTKTSTGAGWQRAVITLTGTVVGVVVIVTLYWAQSVFIPVALAAFLTFLLSPFVTWCRQRGLPRTPAVILVVLFAATVLGGVGWLVTDQIGSLLRELPKYRHNIQDKVQSFKQATGKLNEIQKIVSEVNQEPAKQGARPGPGRDEEKKGAADVVADALAAGDDGADARKEQAGADDGMFASRRPTAVIVEPQGAAWMSRLTSFLSPLLEYLGELALAIILVIFMLLKREELRNRIIRLAGEGKIVVATKFVDEAGQRVSRFLLMQAMVNATFGLLFALGLYLIGVKYAVLWGFLGAMLRYLPYIGPDLAQPGDVRRVDDHVLGDRPVPDAGADHLQLHRAPALRPEHGGLRDRPLDLGGLLGLPVGADRPGPLQPADGLPGGPGTLYPPARVPLGPPGRRAGPRRQHQLLPAPARPRPG
jgi:predicted PurR-regulated permease PerM